MPHGAADALVHVGQDPVIVGSPRDQLADELHAPIEGREQVAHVVGDLPRPPHRRVALLEELVLVQRLSGLGGEGTQLPRRLGELLPRRDGGIGVDHPQRAGTDQQGHAQHRVHPPTHQRAGACELLARCHIGGEHLLARASRPAHDRPRRLAWVGLRSERGLHRQPVGPLHQHEASVDGQQLHRCRSHRLQDLAAPLLLGDHGRQAHQGVAASARRVTLGAEELPRLPRGPPVPLPGSQELRGRRVMQHERRLARVDGRPAQGQVHPRQHLGRRPARGGHQVRGGGHEGGGVGMPPVLRPQPQSPPPQGPGATPHPLVDGIGVPEDLTAAVVVAEREL